MIELDDPIWETFIGGYRLPYNASPYLQALENGTIDTKQIWEEFWAELQHQGDVDIASYAVVPHLVRISIKRELLDENVFALVAVIEERRVFWKNPQLPQWLENDYHSSIKKLAEFGAQNFSKDWSKELTQAFLAVAAFSKGFPNSGRMLIEFSDEEMERNFKEFFEL
jgi:hypothetical protein